MDCTEHETRLRSIQVYPMRRAQILEYRSDRFPLARLELLSRDVEQGTRRLGPHGEDRILQQAHTDLRARLRIQKR